MRTPTRTRRVAAALAAAACVWLLLGAFPSAAQDDADPSVLVTEATGPVTPVMAAHLEDALAEASSAGHDAVLLRIDTPGGLVTSMRDIVKGFLNASTPVIVWVGPSGGGAASAGYVITSAAHVAAMAPGTNIGAATPIDVQGGEVLDKVVNDAVSYARAVAAARDRNADFAEEATRDGASVAASEAVERDIVDLLAESQEQLLDEIDGRKVELAGGQIVELTTAGARTVPYDAAWTRRVLQWLADPNVAFLFMSIGTLGILYELAQPGIGAGAVVGVILILLALFSLSVLPVNAVGVALLILAAVLFLGEVFAPGIGVMAAGGTVALLLGGLFLFQRPTGIGIDLIVLVPTVVLAGLAAGGLAWLAANTRGAPSTAGTDAFTGETTEVRRIRDGRAQIFIGGSWWNARTRDGHDLEEGETVRIVGQDNLDLIVEATASHTAEQEGST
ncbi:MAG: nodulation protein NfeD [Actinobacteria bacterium]|nr:nodulation protein NfeD [Actinomycetota bacterium]